MESAAFPATKFPAAIARAHDRGPFRLTETRYEPRSILRRHHHERACFVVALDGAFIDDCGGAAREVKTGAIIYRPANEPHANFFGERGARCLNVELPLDRCAPRRPTVFTGADIVVIGLSLYAELHRDLATTSPVVEALVSRLLKPRRIGEAPAWLVRTRARLETRIARRVTLVSLAADAGVHPVHLAASFRRYYGTTVGEYLRSLRVAYACRRLAATDVPIADIALSAGFADQSHFGRVFKRMMRMTPDRYRRLIAHSPAS